MRTGRLRSRNHCNNEYHDILVRQLDDGTYEYLVGDSAVRRDGWCTLPAEELANVRWDEDAFTLDQRTEMSQAFDAGNYANAYETNDLDSCDIDEMPEHRRAAFVLGFFGSYTLEEIGSDREAFDEAYFSAAGRYVVQVAKYTDDRSDEYAAEEHDGDDTAGATESGRSND